MSAPDTTTATQLARLASAADTHHSLGVQTNDRDALGLGLRAALDHATSRSAGDFHRRGVIAAAGALMLDASAAAQGRRIGQDFEAAVTGGAPLGFAFADSLTHFDALEAEALR